MTVFDWSNQSTCVDTNRWTIARLLLLIGTCVIGWWRMNWLLKWHVICHWNFPSTTSCSNESHNHFWIHNSQWKTTDTKHDANPIFRWIFFLLAYVSMVFCIYFHKILHFFFSFESGIIHTGSAILCPSRTDVRNTIKTNGEEIAREKRVYICFCCYFFRLSFGRLVGYVGWILFFE